MESSASVSARLWLSSRASKQHCWAVGAPARQATCAGGRAKAQKPAYQVDKFITGNMSISQGYRHTQTTILTHRVAHTWTMQPMSRTCIRVQCQNLHTLSNARTFCIRVQCQNLHTITRTLHAGSGYARRMSVSPPPYPYWRSGCRQRKVHVESCHCPSDFKFHNEKRNEVLRTTARSRRRDI